MVPATETALHVSPSAWTIPRGPSASRTVPILPINMRRPTATGAVRYAVIADGLADTHRGPLIAMTGSIDQAGQVLGYLTGAAIYLLVSPAAALLLDAGSFVLAALILVGLRLPASSAPPAPPARGPTRAPRSRRSHRSRKLLATCRNPRTTGSARPPGACGPRR